MLEYGVSHKLDSHTREVVYQAVERIGATMPRGLSVPRFFKDARVQFGVVDGKAWASGFIFSEYTTCIFENRGRVQVGVAKIGTRPGDWDNAAEQGWKDYPDKWDGQVGQDIALVRAVRLYLVDTSRPLRLGEPAEAGQILRTQGAVDLLLADTVTDVGHTLDENSTVSNVGNVEVSSIEVVSTKAGKQP